MNYPVTGSITHSLIGSSRIFLKSGSSEELIRDNVSEGQISGGCYIIIIVTAEPTINL